MQDVSHTIKENGTERPKTREELKKEWKVRFMGNEEGLEAFMQMTGLNMTKLQVQTFLKKIRGILTYNPKSRIEQFIKESVLEPREIRFDPLVQSMERIDRLNGELSQIEREIGDLEAVTDASAAFEKSEAIVRRDDIMNAYKDYHNLDDEITGLAKKQSQISQQVRDAIHSTQDSRRHHLLADVLISSTRSTEYQTINFEIKVEVFRDLNFF